MKRSAGFTLLELVVAISLAALVAGLGAVLLRTALAGEHRAEQRLADRQALRDSRRLLEHYWARRQGQGFEGKADALVFRLDGGGDVARVGFLCRGESAAYSLQIYRWPANVDPVPDGPTATRYGEVLMTGLRACGFRYLVPPRRGTDAPATWVESWETGAGAPTLMRLDLIDERGSLPPHIVSAPI